MIQVALSRTYSEQCAAITALLGPAGRDLTQISLVRNDDEGNTVPVSLLVDKNLTIILLIV